MTEIYRVSHGKHQRGIWREGQDSRLLCTDIDQLPESLAGSKTEGGCVEGLSLSEMPCVKDEMEGKVTRWASPDEEGGEAMAKVRISDDDVDKLLWVVVF